jgi:hypothetical protein
MRDAATSYRYDASACGAETAGLPNSGERAVASAPIASWDVVAEQTLRLYPALVA